MITMSATGAKNKIGDLWDLATKERVTIERNGSPRFLVVSADTYVAIPREEYDRLRKGETRPPRQIGFAKDLFAGVDVSIHDSGNPYAVLTRDASFDAYASSGVIRVW